MVYIVHHVSEDINCYDKLYDVDQIDTKLATKAQMGLATNLTKSSLLYKSLFVILRWIRVMTVRVNPVKQDFVDLRGKLYKG